MKLLLSTSSEIFISIVIFSAHVLSKKPPPKFSEPVCDSKLGCDRPIMKIKTKIYIEDTLWDQMAILLNDESPENITEKINQNMLEIYKDVNEQLKNLDNGGYVVYFDNKTTVKLNESDITLGDEYVDRLDGNTTKLFNPGHIYPYTFTFQEAIQNMNDTDRQEVDIRVLMLPGVQGSTGTAEETCLCNPKWFGCMIVFQLRNLTNWAFESRIFAHEVGHALGAALHDDEFYTNNPGYRLLMWHAIGYQANIWSPEAKKSINKHVKEHCYPEP